ncbi:hypothetical protein GFL70_36375 [Rhizobium leguminosarum bv. viciae]|nr:hypothetical protein [Rhizobium leguminosarum bv. viciae]
MSQLLQRCTFEPPGLTEILHRELGATIEIAVRYACPRGPPCIGKHLKVLVEPLCVGLRVDAPFQEGQRQPASDAMRQLVVPCHGHAQVGVMVLSY